MTGKATRRAALALALAAMTEVTAMAAMVDIEQICRTGIPGYDPWRDGAGYRFDSALAEYHVRFFPACLCHIKGAMAGQPFVLEPWEQAIVGNLYGWVSQIDGLRRYREALVLVPRKNGKTTLVAGIADKALFIDDEPGAEIYSAAKDREQARLCFGIARDMILQHPRMASKVDIVRNSIARKDGRAAYLALSAEAGTKHGLNPSLVIVDELHAQDRRDLVDVLTTGMGSRRQPLMLYITTSDYARESICNEKVAYAVTVRDGVFSDPAFLPVIYAAGVDDDWTDPAVWARANPNLGVSFQQEFLERECARAKEVPAFENTFKRLYLNICTEQANRWLALDTWDACAGDVPYGPEYEAALEGRPCYAGLDLSTIRDLTAFKLYFPETGHVLSRFWIPEVGAEIKERQDKVPYTAWARAGHITMTPGARIDYDFVRAEINALKKRFDIREIATDPWNAAAITEDLLRDGFEVVEFRQGFASMNAPSKELERLLLGGEIVHGGHPVLRWNAANVACATDPADNIKPDKAKSTERIDGIVALVMAIGRAIVADPNAGRSVYEDRDLVVI